MKPIYFILIIVAALVLSGCATTKVDYENYKPKSSKLANLLFGGSQYHPYDYYPNHNFKNQ